jgi:hypothetical protein
MIVVIATAGRTQATTRQCSQKRIVRRGAIRFCDKRLLFAANFPNSGAISDVTFEQPVCHEDPDTRLTLPMIKKVFWLQIAMKLD